MSRAAGQEGVSHVSGSLQQTCFYFIPIITEKQHVLPFINPHLTYYHYRIGIRYLAGGELSDIRHVFGVSVVEAYNCIECFIESTLHCDCMMITLPRNREEWPCHLDLPKCHVMNFLVVVLVRLMAPPSHHMSPGFRGIQSNIVLQWPL